MSYYNSPDGIQGVTEGNPKAPEPENLILNFQSFIEDDKGDRYDVQVTATAVKTGNELHVTHYSSILINPGYPSYTFHQMLEAAKESIMEEYNGMDIKFDY